MATRYSVATGNWNATSTWATSSGGSSGASVPATGDRAIIEGGFTVTLTGDTTTGGCDIDGGGSAGTLVGGGYTLTCDGDGAATTFDHDGNISGHLDVLLNGAADNTSRNVDLGGGGTQIRNLTCNNANTTWTLINNAVSLTGNLTITAGTLDTGSDLALTVAGDVSVTGTLTGNASAISMKSIDIASGGTYTATSGTTTITGVGGSDYPFKNHTSGNFVHSSGTVTFSSSAYKNFDAGGDPFYNFISTGTSEFRSQRAFTVANDFTISSSGSGYFRPNGNAFTVTAVSYTHLTLPTILRV